MEKIDDLIHEKMELKKGPWTRDEDLKLLAYIEEHGHGSWRSLPAKAGLQRCGKSCRLRWTNYLRPDIKREKFSTQEEKTIIRLHALLGNRWSAIATHLPKRTDNEIKNYWNTRLKKRLTRMGIDPTTHKPKNNPSGSAQSKQAANLSHMAQWETARLEAEARLARDSKRLSKFLFLHKLTGPPPPPPLQPAPPPCLDVLRVWQATTRSGFFGSPGSLESPTSTLSFSGCSYTVPSVGVHGGSSLAVNDVVPNEFGLMLGKDNGFDQEKGKMDNSVQVNNNNNVNVAYEMDYGYNNVMGSMDYGYNVSVNCNSDSYDMTNDIVGDLEDNRNYWNDLLNLVSLPSDSLMF